MSSKRFARVTRRMAEVGQALRLARECSDRELAALARCAVARDTLLSRKRDVVVAPPVSGRRSTH